MQNQPEVYYANANIIDKENKKFVSSREFNFQWLFVEDVGTQKFYKNVFRVSNRMRDYERSIKPDDPDCNWPQHQATIELAWNTKRKNKNLEIFVGKARPQFKTNTRQFFTSALLCYDKAHLEYEADIWIMHFHLKMKFKPHNKPMYPFRAEYKADIDHVTRGEMPW